LELGIVAGGLLGLVSLVLAYLALGIRCKRSQQQLIVGGRRMEAMQHVPGSPATELGAVTEKGTDANGGFGPQA
jgi:hypothetical protein